MTLLVGFAAVNTGNNLLFLMVSAMLGFMAVSGVLGWLNIRGLQVRVEVPDEIYCGLATLVTIRLVSTRRLLPSFLLRVRFCNHEIFFPFLARGGSETGSFVTTFRERGENLITEADICSAFPVNFFVRCNRVVINRRFPVFPAPQACEHWLGAAGAGKRGETSATHRGYEGDVAKIGDYSGSEPLKLIHWRLSAKHGALKVKELSIVTDEPVILNIDLLPGKNLEERLSCGVFLLNRLLKKNRPVGLKTSEKTIRPALSRGHRLQLLGELAVYGKN
jgi:uncharacterized protein (DUF58 family)